MKKIVYLTQSLFANIRREGWRLTFKRVAFFVRYGKGVLSYDEYAVRQSKKRATIKLRDLLKSCDYSEESKIKSISDAVIEQSIDIIIPVYNGFEYLEKLFESITQHTNSAKYRLIIVNDCSPDERVWPFLKKLKQRHPDLDILLHNNEKNLGFVKTVNWAVKQTKNHFIILNTDTEVPKGWLPRMVRPILENPRKIASVTPFTNAGTIFSFPIALEDNDIFLGLSVNQVDDFFARIKSYKKVIVPTGMGFCMAFNKKVVDKIGMFDSKTFGRGYGEENDWSRRATKIGYKNIVATNLFVWHKHGGSFPSAEKQALIAKNLKRLNKKHPGYDLAVQSFIKINPLHLFRQFGIVMLGMKHAEKGLVAIFDHELGGGANDYAKNRIKKLLEQGYAVLEVSYSLSQQEFHLHFQVKKYQAYFMAGKWQEAVNFLALLKAEQVIINEIISYPKPLCVLADIRQFAKSKESKIEFLMHDYFCVCPSYNLLNSKGDYCRVPADLAVCKECLAKQGKEVRLYVQDKDIVKWRLVWRKFLADCDKIVFFSQASQKIVRQTYPQLDSSFWQLKPHQVDYIDRIAEIVPKKENKEIVIGVLGGINHAKGADVILEMLKIIEKQKPPAKLVVIGPFVAKKQKSAHLKVHGRFTRNEIVSLTEKYEIDMFVIPSIWPETFSYTTEEIMQMNMPLAVFDIGAPAERVAHYKKGLVVKNISANEMLGEVIDFVEKERGI